MAAKEIFINVAPGETRIAVRTNNRLSTLELERGASLSILGNIYLGRVQKVAHGIQAAFVDIGVAQSGILALPEARLEKDVSDSGNDQIKDYLNEGDIVCVQVLRDSIADKGAKLTTHINLPGRYLVLEPKGDSVLVSRRIEDKEGKRLQEFVENHCVDDHGYIVRTAASNASEDQILSDAKHLQQQWNNIHRDCESKSSLSCVFTSLSPSLRIIRDAADSSISKIVIDDSNALNEIKKFCEDVIPNIVDQITLYNDTQPLFEAHAIEEEIDAALASRLKLPSGARISIEETAALTAIDVDTASASRSGRQEDVAFECNAAATDEIVRQIRLQNIGGHVVIDFVPMRKRDNQDRLLSSLRGKFQDDSCQVFVGGYTRLGKVELIRQRQRASLSELLLAGHTNADLFQRPKSTETISFEALRRLTQELKANPGKSVELTASSSVIAMLQNGVAKQGLIQFNEILGGPLVMTEQEGLTDGDYQISARYGKA